MASTLATSGIFLNSGIKKRIKKVSDECRGAEGRAAWSECEIGDLGLRLQDEEGKRERMKEKRTVLGSLTGSWVMLSTCERNGV